MSFRTISREECEGAYEPSFPKIINSLREIFAEADFESAEYYRQGVETLQKMNDGEIEVNQDFIEGFLMAVQNKS